MKQAISRPQLKHFPGTRSRFFSLKVSFPFFIAYKMHLLTNPERNLSMGSLTTVNMVQSSVSISVLSTTFMISLYSFLPLQNLKVADFRRCIEPALVDIIGQASVRPDESLFVEQVTHDGGQNGGHILLDDTCQQFVFVRNPVFIIESPQRSHAILPIIT